MLARNRFLFNQTRLHDIGPRTYFDKYDCLVRTYSFTDGRVSWCDDSYFLPLHKIIQVVSKARLCFKLRRAVSNSA
jgi:hypothetical protein